MNKFMVNLLNEPVLVITSQFESSIYGQVKQVSLTDFVSIFFSDFPPYTCYTTYNITIWFNYASVRNKC